MFVVMSFSDQSDAYHLQMMTCELLSHGCPLLPFSSALDFPMRLSEDALWPLEATDLMMKISPFWIIFK